MPIIFRVQPTNIIDYIPDGRLNLVFSIFGVINYLFTLYLDFASDAIAESIDVCNFFSMSLFCC